MLDVFKTLSCICLKNVLQFNFNMSFSTNVRVLGKRWANMNLGIFSICCLTLYSIHEGQIHLHEIGNLCASNGQAMGGNKNLAIFSQSVDTPCAVLMNDRSTCKKLMIYVQAMVEQWANKNLTIFAIC